MKSDKGRKLRVSREAKGLIGANCGRCPRGHRRHLPVPVLHLWNLPPLHFHLPPLTVGGISFFQVWASRCSVAQGELDVGCAVFSSRCQVRFGT